MSLVVRANLPRCIERGQAVTLDLPVYDSDGTEQTASAGTVTLSLASKALVDGRALTSLGPPATLALLAGDTEDESLSSQGLEVWTLTIGGAEYSFRRPFYLVRHAFHSTILDVDLTDRHSELLDETVRPASGNYEAYREAASAKIQRKLIRMGRRPHLIFDAWSLADAHIALTLHLIFLDFFNRLSSDTYKDLADHYAEQFEEEFGRVDFRYDENESGTVDSTATVSAERGSVTLTAGNPGGWWRGGWR